MSLIATNNVASTLVVSPSVNNPFLDTMRLQRVTKIKGFMSETKNIAAIAGKIQNEIFKVFHWQLHAQEDANFDCVSSDHMSENGQKKKTHPGDVVYHYFDPYLNRRVFLHTDLKAYSKSSIKQNKIRDALKSLAMTVECAAVTNSWRTKFQSTEEDPFEVRGLLFVANHDNKSPGRFRELLKGIALRNIPVAKGQTLHILGPDNIADLFSIATDIKLSILDKDISTLYRFFYPDLTLWKRHTAEDERVGATIEMLLSPYFVLKYSPIADEKGIVLKRRGSIVYYSRPGSTVEEFVYLLDSLSRYQLVNSQEDLRVRVYSRSGSKDIKNNFDKAKKRYCQMWGFEGGREQEISSISIDSIQQLSPNYKADELGWNER